MIIRNSAHPYNIIQAIKDSKRLHDDAIRHRGDAYVDTSFSR